jgi:hypothetical protein
MLPGCQKRTKSLPKYSIYCREKPETTSLHCKFQDAKNFHSSLRKSKITWHPPTHRTTPPFPKRTKSLSPLKRKRSRRRYSRQRRPKAEAKAALPASYVTLELGFLRLCSGQLPSTSVPSKSFEVRVSVLRNGIWVLQLGFQLLFSFVWLRICIISGMWKEEFLQSRVRLLN